jgi:RNA polymerase sigma factor (sigma-70 family)
MKDKKDTIEIEDYVGLVRSVIAKYKGYSLPVDDLFQEGMMGLMEAKKRYDAGKGASFATYAVFWIKKRIIDALKNERKVSMDALEYDDELLNSELVATQEKPDSEEEEAVRKIVIPPGFPVEESKFLILHYDEQKTLAEIASIMGLSREKIRQLKQKALRRLKLTKS